MHIGNYKINIKYKKQNKTDMTGNNLTNSFIGKLNWKGKTGSKQIKNIVVLC